MGLMLGSSCSPCCGSGSGDSPCPCETDATLPAAVTVSFSGPQGGKEPGASIISLSFSSCYGSGGAGTVDAPGGDRGVDEGPLNSVTLTSAGSGYAKLGRTSPTLTLANAAEEPATVTITLSQQTDSCSLPYWEIASIAVTEAGDGYFDGEALEITLAPGDTQEVAATGQIYTARGEPSLAASGSGSGATFSVTVASNGDTPETWGVASVTVSGTTSGWTDGEYLTISGDGVTEDEAASVQVFTGREEPVAVVFVEESTGSGAVIEAAFTQFSATPGAETWKVSSLSITNGGQGYEVGNLVEVYEGDGFDLYAEGSVSAVDGNGAITAVVLTLTYESWANTDAIASIVVNSAGKYFDPQPGLGGVTITNGGRYYREDATLAALVATVNISVVQPGGTGTGAVISAEIEDDPTSPDFGKITGLSLDNAGSGYLGYLWIRACDCDWRYAPEEGETQDREVVCWRVRSDCGGAAGDVGCYYVGYQCWPKPGDRVLGLPPAPPGDDDDGPGGCGPGLVGGEGNCPEDEEEDEEPPPQPTNDWGYYSPPNSSRPQACLVRVRLTSSIRLEDRILLDAPTGIPGVDNGPVLRLLPGGTNQLGQLSGWAYVNENNEVVAPPITAEVFDYLPSQGSGAEVTATINTDPDSESFGDVTLAVTAGGSGYLGAVEASAPVYVFYNGQNTPPTVSSLRPTPNALDCPTVYTADEPVTCDDFSFTAKFGLEGEEQLAEVTPGGDVTEIFEGSNKCCLRCFMCCPESPEQIVVTFTREANDGDSVLEEDNPSIVGNPNGALIPSFSNLGYQEIEFSGGKYHVDCPEHEVEIVWDVADLHAENRCGSLVPCDDLPDVTDCYSEASLDPDTRVSFNDEPLAFPNVPGSPEITSFLDSSITVLGSAGSCPELTVQVVTRWQHISSGGLIVVPTSVTHTQTKTYTKPSGESCGSVPGEWVETVIDDGEPGDQYTVFLGPIPGDENSIYIASARRICNNYDVTVEFQ